MDYKKYKPLTTPGRWHDCQQKNIVKAYRALCDPCAIKKIEVRVPRDQAAEMGLLHQDEPSEEVPGDEAAVSQQVIVEEAAEEEEVKDDEEKKTPNKKQIKD